MNSNPLVAFIAECNIDRLPAEVVAAGRCVLLDALGVGLAGSLMPSYDAVYRFITNFPMEPMEATIWGRSLKTSALWAALANGWAASCLDADDGHREAMGHPGAAIVPAAVAVAERIGASGRDLVEAVIVGYEIGIRVGIFLNRDHRSTYFGSGTWATIGAAAACAKLLQLDSAQILSALSIGEVNTPLALIMNWINVQQIPDVKEGIGWGALTGVCSSLLAERGVKGVFSLTKQPESQMITCDLGAEFEILKVYYKNHSSCRWTHTAIDGILQMVENHGLSDKEIKKVIVATHLNASQLDNRSPSRAVEAQYSIPYTIAAAIIHGRVEMQQMLPKAIKDSRTLALARRIEVKCADELESRFPEASLARLTVEKVNGEKITAEPSKFTKGDYQNPFTGPELERKFCRYAGCRLSAGKVDEILQAIRKIENIESVKELTQLL